MTFFMTTYERTNFGFHTPVKQSFDVVFEIDEKEYSNDKHQKFSRIAQEAASKQIPQIDHKNTGLPLGEGWSSMTGGHKFIHLDIPWIRRKIQKPSPGKPVIACIYTVPDPHNVDGSGIRSYRATGFYKIIKDNYKPDKVMAEVFPELTKPRWKVVQCLPKDAQIISGRGIAGSLDLIQDITVGELVKWNENAIKQEQWNYEQSLKISSINDRLSFDIGRFIPEWTKRLGLPAVPK